MARRCPRMTDHDTENGMRDGSGVVRRHTKGGGDRDGHQGDGEKEMELKNSCTARSGAEQRLITRSPHTHRIRPKHAWRQDRIFVTLRQVLRILFFWRSGPEDHHFLRNAEQHGASRAREDGMRRAGRRVQVVSSVQLCRTETHLAFKDVCLFPRRVRVVRIRGPGFEAQQDCRRTPRRGIPAQRLHVHAIGLHSRFHQRLPAAIVACHGEVVRPGQCCPFRR